MLLIRNPAKVGAKAVVIIEDLAKVEILRLRLRTGLRKVENILFI